MDAEYLLTATRSARKTLDLDAPVDLDVIHECLGIGLQAANGSNQQAWRWVVVTDADLRSRIGQWYRETYLSKVGGQFIADLMPGGTPESRLMSSTEWLAADLPRRLELPAGVAHPRLRHVHHDTAPAPRTRHRRTARHPRVLCAGVPAARRPAPGGTPVHTRPAPGDRRRDRSQRMGELMSDDELSREVRRLADRAGIRDCIERYAARDWTSPHARRE